MIKKHTAKSLGKYIGNKIGVVYPGAPIRKSHYLVGELIEVSTVKNEGKFIDVNDMCNITWVPFSDSEVLPVVSEIFEKLIELGFGAMKNEESETGYVDLFGPPFCLKES